MRFISSSELDNIDGVEYLHIYLKPVAAFNIKVNGEELEQNEIYIKAPTMSSKDVYDISKCCTVFAKLEEVPNEKLTKELSKLSEEERAELFSNFKNIEETIKNEVKPEDIIKDHVRNILQSSKAYESGNSDFYTEFNKISYFLEQRLHHMIEKSLFKMDLSVFNKLLTADKHFLIEELFIEYVGFFFRHFPLENLSFQSKK